jgi:hypothetical protein
MVKSARHKAQRTVLTENALAIIDGWVNGAANCIFMWEMRTHMIMPQNKAAVHLIIRSFFVAGAIDLFGTCSKALLT